MEIIDRTFPVENEIYGDVWMAFGISTIIYMRNLLSKGYTEESAAQFLLNNHKLGVKGLENITNTLGELPSSIPPDNAVTDYEV